MGTDTTDRPGPPAILPGLAPGGVVVQVYVEHTLAVEQRIPADADVERLASEAAEQADQLARRGGRVCLVAFDGDDGHRFSAQDWTSGPP